MRNVILHIDRLVLHGVAASDRRGLVQGLHAELARQFASSVAVAGVAAMAGRARLDMGTVRAPYRSGPGGLGAAVARGIAQAGRR
jgi:hypothetical protein